MPMTVKDRMKASIQRSRQDVFLRDDFKHLGTYRQISRALSALQEEAVVIRAGYGVYLRPSIKQLEEGLDKVARRLGSRVARQVTIDGTTVHLGRTAPQRNQQSVQDERKLGMAQRILERFSSGEIRRQSLANLRRWQAQGVWVSAFDEWTELMLHASDDQLRDVMIGVDERANRLRQSAPYAGLLSQDEVEQIR